MRIVAGLRVILRYGYRSVHCLGRGPHLVPIVCLGMHAMAWPAQRIGPSQRWSVPVAAYKMQGQLRSPREADMIDQYYQLLWEHGTGLKVRDFARANELDAGGLDTPNYAWYHAGLLRMFRQLEEMKGGELLPALLEAIGRRHPGVRSVPQDQMIQTFSAVIGQDLKPWFKERWHLDGPSR